MNTVQNPIRGCGQLVPGGVYVRGRRGMGSAYGGSLGGDGTDDPYPFAWVLGEGITGGRNYTVDSAARKKGGECHPGYTLANFDLIDMPLNDVLPPHLAKLGSKALIDRVGSSFYTPWQFAKEIEAFGPSRRVTLDEAKQIADAIQANGGMLPILFVHGAMPLVEAAWRDAFAEWAGSDPAARFAPTPERPDFGIGKGDYNGRDHWLVQVLASIHVRANATHKKRCSAAFLPGELSRQVMMFDQLFGISFVSDTVYVMKGDEDKSYLKHISRAGIEPVAIEWGDDDE